MRHVPTFVPLLPRELLRPHHCDKPTDTRYRAVARLAQSLWRTRQGLACGKVTDPVTGRRRLLGSLLTPTAAKAGANFLDPALVPLVRRELAWREPGAVIEERRLWGNLLSSQALAFSLFLPLKHDLALATHLFRQLFPDLVGTVTAIFFEHSPSRGHPAFTGENTAFDVLVRCTTPAGQSAFVAIEMKYSEAPGGSAVPVSPRLDDLSRSLSIYRDPDATALRGGQYGQFWRQQLLAAAMLQQGLYERGSVVVLAPAPNSEIWHAIIGYAAHLKSDSPTQCGFAALTLEAFIEQLVQSGAEAIAGNINERYLDLGSVYSLLDRYLESGLPPAIEQPSTDLG